MTRMDDLAELLKSLCPMFLLVDQKGRILRVGPTLQKLRPDCLMERQSFLDVFEMVRPRTVTTKPALMAMAGANLHLRFHDEPRTALKGLVAPLPGGEGAVINLSFGISILDAVRDYALTSADFSGTDLAIELLYLVEAKSAAMDASRSLNLRLQGAMLAAEEQAYTDTLTGVKNRRAMDSHLGQMTASNSSFAVMQIDLDYFKSVNDRLGHAAGDFVLQQAALIMIEETRDGDTVARIGGDEFVIIFQGLSNTDRLSTIADRLIERLNQPMSFQDKDCCISASIGTALSSHFDNPRAEDVLQASDLALYQAKREGRSCHRLYSTLLKAQS